MPDSQGATPPTGDHDASPTDLGPQQPHDATARPAYHFLHPDDAEAVRLLREIHGLPPVSRTSPDVTD